MVPPRRRDCSNRVRPVVCIVLDALLQPTHFLGFHFGPSLLSGLQRTAARGRSHRCQPVRPARALARWRLGSILQNNGVVFNSNDPLGARATRSFHSGIRDRFWRAAAQEVFTLGEDHRDASTAGPVGLRAKHEAPTRLGRNLREAAQGLYAQCKDERCARWEGEASRQTPDGCSGAARRKKIPLSSGHRSGRRDIALHWASAIAIASKERNLRRSFGLPLSRARTALR